MDKDGAQGYLRSLLNKNLRVSTTDGRLFWGSFKCTDAVRSVFPPQNCYWLTGANDLLRTKTLFCPIRTSTDSRRPILCIAI